MSERFQKCIKRLPAYPLHGDGESIVVDVEGAPPIEYNIAVPATPVFPGDVVTWWSSPDEKELFTRTIGGLEWNGNNSTLILAIARARLSMPGSQEWLRTEVKERTRPNGTMSLNRLHPHRSFNDFGHYTEQFGTPMAVSELMLQSVGDILRVFPALKPGCKASFKNLRAQGGFLVSAGGQAGNRPEPHDREHSRRRTAPRLAGKSEGHTEWRGRHARTGQPRHPIHRHPTWR